MRRAALLLLVAGLARAEPVPRFFVEGDGTLALTNAHTGAHVDVRYRRADGTYDDEAIARIRRAMRSRGDDGPGAASLRLIEVLGYVERYTGGRPLRLQSGYRSPAYNEGLRKQGAKAASGSLHTEGLAADLAFGEPDLLRLWHRLRRLGCCGAGYYAREGFVHVDVGRPRFWEAETSRVDENLSGGNARVFARTEFDRYRAGEPVVVTLHALTVPPVRIARRAQVVGEGGAPLAVALEADLPARDGCFEVTATGARLRAVGVAPGAPVRLALETCAPRAERTPARIETNPLEVR